MGDVLMYGGIAVVAAGVFFFCFKQVSGSDGHYKPIDMNNCPLCGEKTGKFVTMGTFKHDTTNKVVCTKCGATTKEYTSYKAAVEAWNRGEAKAE